jgi:CBS domain-containing protein
LKKNLIEGGMLMKVESILAKKGPGIYSIRPDQTVADALKMVNEKRVGALMVVDQNQNIEGIVSERDLLRKFAAAEGNVKEMLVKDVMTPKEKLIVAQKNDDIQYVMRMITNNRIRHIPIIDGGKLVGLVSIGDVIQILLESAEFERKMLMDYISQG